MFTAPVLLRLLTSKASVSTRCAPPVPTLAVKLTSEVSRRPPAVPIPLAVMSKTAAVMSKLSLPLASASSTAPWAARVTVWPAALRLAMLRSLPVAVVVMFTAPVLLRLLTSKASVSCTYKPPAPKVPVKVPKEVSKVLAAVPTLLANTVNVVAVMSTESLPRSPSSTAPTARSSAVPLACRPWPPSVKSPAASASTKLPCNSKPSNTALVSGWAWEVPSGKMR